MVLKRDRATKRSQPKGSQADASQVLSQGMRRAGLRPTPQRLAIASFCLTPGHHPTMTDIRRWAKKHLSHVSLATIYNTINALVRADIVREVRLPHSSETVFDGNLARHHHFLDEKTGELCDIEWDAVRVSTALGGEFSVVDFEVLVRGTRKSSAGVESAKSIKGGRKS